MLAAFQRSLTYFPDPTRPTPAESDVPELAPVSLGTEDGLSLLAWYAPPRVSDAPSLAYFHGNAGHIGMRGFKVRAYLNAGLGVLLTTWRGYSGNPGTPTEDGLYADGRAARAFLRAHGCGDERQILYGESLGTGVAVHLAREAAPGALVLEAPFSSIVDIARGRFPLLPVGPLIVDRFDSAAKIGKVAAPGPDRARRARPDHPGPPRAQALQARSQAQGGRVHPRGRPRRPRGLRPPRHRPRIPGPPRPIGGDVSIEP